MFQNMGLRDYGTTRLQDYGTALSPALSHRMGEGGPRDYGTTGLRVHGTWSPGVDPHKNVEFQSCMSNASANCEGPHDHGTTRLQDHKILA